MTLPGDPLEETYPADEAISEAIHKLADVCRLMGRGQDAEAMLRQFPVQVGDED